MSKFNEVAKLLCEFAGNGQVEQLRRLANPSNVNKTYQGATPLMEAAKLASAEGAACAQILLQSGADPSIVCGAGKSAMHFAALSNNTEVMRLLSKFRSLVDLRTEMGETPLMWAAAVNKTEAVQLLVSMGADLRARNRSGKTAADKAKENESWLAFIAITDTDREKRLTKEEKKRLVETEKESERLCSLAGSCDLRQLKRIATSHNCDWRWESRTPLMEAAAAANNEGKACAALLLKLGADSAVGDWQGWTAAHFAAEAGNDQILEMLPRSSVDLKDCDGWTPLMLAANLDRDCAVQKLIELGVNLEPRDICDKTPLMTAKSGGHRRVVQMLREATRDGVSDREFESYFEETEQEDADEDDVDERHNSQPVCSRVATARQSYPCTNPQGLCVVINIENFKDSKKLPRRKGSQKDVQRIQSVFTDMNFTVQVAQDLEAHEIHKFVIDTAQRNHDRYGCLVCFLMSHGFEGAVYGSDGRHQQLRDIASQFKANCCPSLRDKPKIFFVQACRRVHDSVADRDSEPAGQFCPADGDFLFCYANTEDSYAYRDSEAGSVFVQTLCDVVEELHEDEDLATMLTVLSSRVSRRQAPVETVTEVRSTLRRKTFWR